ncbi:MAG: amidase [Pseudolabrys sp.]|nr:amidase [Pseudolabrys sp.]
MTEGQVYRSAFVPHDLEAPISGAPSGALAGLTAVIKDMYGIAGYVAGCGNPRWLETHQPAAETCPTVMKLINAGATITGKTICDEFFFSVSGINAHYGAPVNARAPGRISGGSSSGSASAVGANIADIALGSDTGGSVRVPASFNGIYGLRPTHGRIDATGVQDMAPSLDVPGFFAATPGVFRNVGSVLLDERRIPAKIQRVIVLEDAFAEADPEVDDLLRTLLELMSDDLPAMTHAKIAPDGLEAWRETFRIVQAAEVWQTFGAWVTRENPEIGPGVKERMAFAASVTKRQHEAASAARAQMRDHVFQIVKPGTILALPTAPCIAPPLDIDGEDAEKFRARVLRLTCIASLSGLPQVSIPAGTMSGCPIGLSFIGWAGGDEALLDLSYALSRHLGMAG